MVLHNTHIKGQQNKKETNIYVVEYGNENKGMKRTVNELKHSCNSLNRGTSNGRNAINILIIIMSKGGKYIQDMTLTNGKAITDPSCFRPRY